MTQKEEWNGIIPIEVAVTSVICDFDDANDPPIINRPFVWVGTEGEGVFIATNGDAAFDPGINPVFRQSNGFEDIRYVYDIVRAPGTHGNTAVLYAATTNGVWRSTDGGDVWNATSRFSGDFINCLAIHPRSTGGADDIIVRGHGNRRCLGFPR